MDTLSRNIAALQAVDPSLAQRLHHPVASDHVRLPSAEGPPPAILHRRAWLPLALGAPAVEELLAPFPAGEPLLLMGLGLGEILRAAVAREDLPRIVAWERDPWLLRLVLAASDLREPIRSGRLRLALATDLLPLLPWGHGVLSHPLARHLYPWELSLLAQPPGERRALLATGELFVDDLAAALREHGWAVLPFEITRHARPELEHQARASGAQLVAAINHTHGLAELCTALRLPLLCWEIDPATDHPRVSGDVSGAWIFSYRRANLPGFERAGFQHLHYLPLAANPAARRPPEEPLDPRHLAPVSFVGASMAANSIKARDAFVGMLLRWKAQPPDRAPGGPVQQALRLLEGTLLVQRGDPCRFVIPELLELRCPGLRAWAQEQGLQVPVMLVGELAAAEKRLNVVASLGPLGMRAWGDEGWKLCAKAGVQVMGRAGHGREINAIYAGSTVNLDVNRIYQPDIATMRVFDILACGGFALAEHNEALAELFELGVEIDTWRSLEELAAKTRHYIAHPEQARAIAEAGRSRVLADHTIAQRLDTMLRTSGLGPRPQPARASSPG